MSALNIIERASPSHDSRGGRAVRFLIFHYTGMANAKVAIDRLCDPTAKVSAHYCVDEEGLVTAMVPEDRRAWHAGLSSWAGESDINALSIGIEIANGGHEFGLPDYPMAQMQALALLSADILKRHHIAPADVLGHSDVAPARKADPGEKFDWRWLAAQRIGHWVEPAPLDLPGPVLQLGMTGEDVQALQMALADYGYAIETNGQFDKQTQAVVSAFQRHFRTSKIDGRADASTQDTLKRLINTRA